jgi:hypothetical protein
MQQSMGGGCSVSSAGQLTKKLNRTPALFRHDVVDKLASCVKIINEATLKKANHQSSNETLNFK